MNRRRLRAISCLILSSASISLSISGCKDDSAGKKPEAPAPAPAQPATTPASTASAPATQAAAPNAAAKTPAKREDVVGTWIATKVTKLPQGLPEHWRLEFLAQSLLLLPDGTYHRFTNAGGQFHGTWTLQNDAVTLVRAFPPGAKRFGKDDVYRAANGTLTTDDDTQVVFTRQSDNEPAIKTTAVELFKLCKEDPKSATERFNGKRVEVSAVAGMIRPSMTNTQFALSGTREETAAISGFDGVWCTPLDHHFWTKCASGQPVKVTGRVLVFKDRAIVYFAEVQTTGEPKIVPIAAADLAREWKAGAKPTIEKYAPDRKEKPLLVSGKVLEVTRSAGGDPEGLYLGDGESRVFCHMDWDSDLKTALATLKPGDDFQVLGMINTYEESKPYPSLRMCVGVWK